MKTLKIAALILTLFTGLSVYGELAPTSDGKTYRLVCDPTGTADFLKGSLAAGSKCSYVDAAAMDYMSKHDKACDDSKDGQMLRRLLGPACETAKNLQIRPATYVRFQQCSGERQPASEQISSCMDIYQVQRDHTQLLD